MSKQLAARISEELLPAVTKPAQYVGREFNQLVRDGDWGKADVRMVVGFPDTYAIGMSHLGCQILYWIANHTPGVCAERCYVPWVDALDVMRRRGIPLFTWDTRQSVASADIIGVSLQYEMAFTSLLLMLDLAGVPLRANVRDDTHPLVLVGGPQADNPEPIAEFVDLVVIGDGEESLPAILAAYRELKAGGVRRRDTIEIMARRFPWLYAPNLYHVRYGDDGAVAEVAPHSAGGGTGVSPVNVPVRRGCHRATAEGGCATWAIERCRTTDFENAPVPLRPIVPHTETVHDRMAIEIMRGCPQRCLFCHAGRTKRPVLVRSVDKILELAEEQYRATGGDELGLLSLSTSDYPQLKELTARINERFAGRRVSISVPSLRVDRMLQDVPWMTRSVRKSGLTIAVEAASERLRTAIRKKVTDGDLMAGLLEAYKAGWRRAKCYFMAGFPGETEEDIRAIHGLSVEMSELRRRLGGGPAAITASVSWLVPKPHTPLQWAAQQRLDYFEHARRVLKELQYSRRSKAVQIKTHSPERSVLEGVLARGDRRLGAVIERAYRLGASLDGWDECFRHERWRRAFDETGVDPDWYAHRERPVGEVLPWDHIHAGAPRDHLARHYSEMFAVLDRPVPAPGILPL
jgi:radical SAM superfamily enzyme YgiQ (UPF0313 family)